MVWSVSSSASSLRTASDDSPFLVATAHDVLSALSDLGVEDRGLVRVLAIGMPFPLDETGDDVRRRGQSLLK